MPRGRAGSAPSASAEGRKLSFRVPAGGRQCASAGARRAGSLSAPSICATEPGSRSPAQRRGESCARSRVLPATPGVLRSAVDSSYAVADESPASVSCGSSSQASIGDVYWKKTRRWWIGATAPGLERDAVVEAVRNAQGEWTNNINWCGTGDQANPPASYQGKTSDHAVKNDGKSVVDWGSLANDQNCSQALACTFTWYDGNGAPIESDIRFNTAFLGWSTTRAPRERDRHPDDRRAPNSVTSCSSTMSRTRPKHDDTTLMWPCRCAADTSTAVGSTGRADADRGPTAATERGRRGDGGEGLGEGGPRRHLQPVVRARARAGSRTRRAAAMRARAGS